LGSDFWPGSGLAEKENIVKPIAVCDRWNTWRGKSYGAKPRSRLKALAERYPRYGYPTLHEMCHAEGLVRDNVDPSRPVKQLG
jgi:hypothetical protein